MRDLAYITRLGYELSNKPNSIFGKSPVRETGGHRYEGILITAGVGIASHDETNPIWLGDIAPTILHILGCPVPVWMDGQVLTSWLSDELKNNPIQILDKDIDHHSNMSNTLSAKEEEELMERLSDLGYLG